MKTYHATCAVLFVIAFLLAAHYEAHAATPAPSAVVRQVNVTRHTLLLPSPRDDYTCYRWWNKRFWPCDIYRNWQVGA